MWKILAGGVLGGILMFGWGFVSHEVLPLGRMGFSEMPNEQKVVGSLKASINEPGLYFFPYTSHKETSKSEQEAWEAKYKEGPVGMMVYHPQGGEVMGPRQLGIELGSDVLAAIIAAWLLSLVSVGYGMRVLFVTLLGVVCWVSIEVSYWNWYGFPRDYALGQLADQVGGFLVAGLVMAAIVKPSFQQIEMPV